MRYFKEPSRDDLKKAFCELVLEIVPSGSALSFSFPSFVVVRVWIIGAGKMRKRVFHLVWVY